ncbi:hypothetical protein ATANTOWER_016138 [Ataeniobius toweri]|uniref:Uncharacterized protein n=1 Tax=Ataeniobius toweri TaxID=208326 RepID=A0ABU7AHH1_9TELE|nr:hypothetical protein [Ataeniobius toweri]
MARTSISDASWTPSPGGVPGTSHREEAQGTAQDTLEGLCLSAGLGTPWAPPGGAGGGVSGEGRLGVCAESAAPATRSRISGRRRRRVRQGWGCSEFNRLKSSPWFPHQLKDHFCKPLLERSPRSSNAAPPSPAALSLPGLQHPLFHLLDLTPPSALLTSESFLEHWLPL